MNIETTSTVLVNDEATHATEMDEYVRRVMAVIEAEFTGDTLTVELPRYVEFVRDMEAITSEELIVFQFLAFCQVTEWKPTPRGVSITSATELADTETNRRLLELHSVYVLLKEYTVNSIIDFDEHPLLDENDLRKVAALSDRYDNFIEIYNHM